MSTKKIKTSKIARKKWVNQFISNYGKKSMPFDFKKFMTLNNLTVEDLITDLNYSKLGIILMLSRGTIKPSLLAKLKIKYKNVDNCLNKKGAL